MTEKSEIKRDGAKAIKNSGRGSHQKGDSVFGDFVVDYKEYPKGFRVGKAEWAKICTDAMRTDRTKSPALKIIMGEGSDIIRLAVIEWGVLEQLVEEIQTLTEENRYLIGFAPDDYYK
jgi:hypothetical protein